MTGRTKPRVQREERGWDPPELWPRLVRCQVLGLLAVREEPGSDVVPRRIPLRRPGRPAVLIQARSEGAVRHLLPTALVGKLAWGVNIAILRRSHSITPNAPTLSVEVQAGVHRSLVAVLAGMQRRRGVGLLVHGFHDVVLAPARPGMVRILSEHPPRRPSAACSGHMIGPEHEEPVVVDAIRQKLHRGSAIVAPQRRGGIDAHEDPVPRGRNHTFGFGLGPVYKVDNAVGWILPSVEGPLVIEPFAHVLLFKLVVVFISPNLGA
mmetsp:Transcript_92662/g.167445  ORF Transcript_92662/g.167445 Transcript_92662/m.167445 type:complete len:265 (+) Transcript_92662:1249-2043(+)